MKHRPNPYTVVQWTTHYRIVNGRTYRDAVALRAGDPRPRLVSFPEAA
jgi:hypothetical protein